MADDQDATKQQNPPAQQPNVPAEPGTLMSVAENAVVQITHIVNNQNSIGISNPHSVALYKKSLDGQHEITGPMTVEAFRESEFYKDRLSTNTSQMRDFLDTQISTYAERQTKTDAGLRALQGQGVNISGVVSDKTNHEVGDKTNYLSPKNAFEKNIGLDSEISPDTRVVVVSELEDNKFIAKKVLLGRYEEYLSDNAYFAAPSADQSQTNMSVKGIKVDSVYNLETNQKFKINGTTIPLSESGVLLQQDVDKLIVNLPDLSALLKANNLNTSTDKKTTIQIRDTDKFSGLDRDLLRLLGPSSEEGIKEEGIKEEGIKEEGIKGYGLAMDIDRLHQLDAQVDSGSFTKTLAITDTDPATGKDTHRVLLGNSRNINQIDPLTRQPIEIDSFTKSFNVDTGKTSMLEKPIEVPVADGYIRQENIDEVVKQVHEAVQKNEISMAHPFKSLVPDVLPAGGLVVSNELGEHGHFSPGTTSAKPTKESIAPGKKATRLA
jgi:hypothetical protein